MENNRNSKTTIKSWALLTTDDYNVFYLLHGQRLKYIW